MKSSNLKPSTSQTQSYAQLSGNEVLSQLKSSPEGLSENEAATRLKKHGPNELPRQPPTAWWMILIRQFKSPLIFILALAAAISLWIQEFSDALFIAAVLIINSLIGGYQEWKAEKSNRALEKFLKFSASVLREGELREIDAQELVPGDVVWLEAGFRVPADVRLLQEHGLEVNESALTGESLPVQKTTIPLSAGDKKNNEVKNLAYAGTTVVRGRAQAVVVTTGTQTVIGQLALDVLSTKGGKPPLMLRLEKFTRVVGIAVVLAVLVVALVGWLHGYTLTEMFFFAVALGVAAVPEGLLVAITVALAIATNRMAKRKVIVRQLAVVEGLGSCNYIASDKTGTLTCNELTVKEIRLADGTPLKVSGQGFEPEGEIKSSTGEPVNLAQVRDEGRHRGLSLQEALQNLLRAALLCNEGDLHLKNSHWIWHGDPTDVALLALGRKGHLSRERLLEEWVQVNEIPFEAEHQFAATFHRRSSLELEKGSRETIRKEIRKVFVKGAPERLFAMADSSQQTEDLEKLHAMASEMTQQGYRVLALAEGEFSASLTQEETPPEPKGLTILGFVGMIDPLRPRTAEAVQACHAAGIRVAMVTGDHPQTALAIARNLGLAESMDQVVTGAALTQISPQELQDIVSRTKVFSRVLPHDKLRIVEAAQANGDFVAVTGDGVNDAPALKAANIGVAMGKGGTDVARDAADIVISDDNFATIVSGVEEGRVAYGNVRNVINLLITQGAAEVIVVALGVLFGLPLPLLPVQLLWLNLVTNGIQDVALAFEPGMGDELKHPPRKAKEGIFNRLMVERVFTGSAVIGLVGFGMYYWLIKKGWKVEAARNLLLLLMVLFENIHLGNCRSETKSILKLSPLRSPLLLFGALGALLVHLLFMFTPWGQAILGTQAISLQTFVTLFALALTVFVAMEIHKWSWRRRYG